MPRIYRRRRPKKTYKKKSIDAKQSKAITVLKKKVKALEAPIELKYLYQYYDIDTIAPTPIVNTMNLIRPWSTPTTPGTNANLLHTREGKTVCMKSLNVKGKLMIPYEELSPDRETATRIRMIYVYYPDEPPSTSINDVLETTLVASGLSLVDCFYKRNSKLKYKILKDVTYNLEANYWNYTNTPSTPLTNQHSGFTSTKPQFQSIRHNIPLSKLPGNGKVVWKDELAVPSLGLIAMFIFTDNQNLELEFNGQSQLTFQDQ